MRGANIEPLIMHSADAQRNDATVSRRDARTRSP